MSGGDAAAVALVLGAGVAGSVQIAVMGVFGQRIGTIEALAFASVVQAALTVGVVLAARQSLGLFGRAAGQPAWMWIGGLMGGFIVFSITFAAPRIGTTATIGLVIAGQLAMGAVIDKLGLFGLEKLGLPWPRLLGIALLAAGATLSLKR